MYDYIITTAWLCMEMISQCYCYLLDSISQISPTSASPRLSNNKTFPHFIRTFSSEAETIYGILHAMKQFEWSRIAVITQSDNLFTFVSVNLYSFS